MSLKQMLPHFTTAQVQTVYEKVFEYRDMYLKLKEKMGTKFAVEQMYYLVDYASKESYKQASCKKGCNFCCHIHVMTTEAEAEVIASKVTPDMIEALQDQAKQTEETRPFSEHSACVFLKNGECSIYAIRPAACRKYFSIEDPSFCDTSKYFHRNVQLTAAIDAECIASGLLCAEKRGNFAELLLKYYKNKKQ
jgi:Fe-S-cluster containining protein